MANVDRAPHVVNLTRPLSLSATGRARALVGIHPDMRYMTPEFLGGKAFSLHRMAFLGLNVPLAYAITVPAWREWTGLSEPERGPFVETLVKRVLDHMTSLVSLPRIEARGLAVRSGAAVSMPGMMDTTLNVPTKGIAEHVTKVFESFHSPRCVAYRKERGIGEIGTACVIQLMVPSVDKGGSGVVTSIDPVRCRGWDLYGEWLPKELGLALVGGTKTPAPIEKLREEFPAHSDVLRVGLNILENAWSCPVEVEFAFNPTLVYFLQCRAAKLAKPAQPRAAAMRTQGMEYLGRGLPASPGDHIGVVGADIWVSDTTAPEEYEEMAKAKAIVTYRGGVTCHAAVVARDMGKPCVVGFSGEALLPGAKVCVIGSTGEVYRVGE